MAAATHSEKIYQASDLNRGYRAVLDEARGGQARLRDTDGTALLVVREERVANAESVNEAAATFLVLEDELRRDAELSLGAYGEWSWLRVFDREDLSEFIVEVRGALVIAARERSTRVLDDTLLSWYNTAISLDDPARREILLGGVQDDDFVQVSRPEPVAETSGS